MGLVVGELGSDGTCTAPSDRGDVDLLVVIGTSLLVPPVNQIPGERLVHITLLSRRRKV
jgi:NAD-dependent SIR2 family protein deacetylase